MRRKKSLRLLGKKEATCREKWRQSSRWLINVAAKLELWVRREYTCWRPQMTVAWKVCLSQLPICQRFGLKTKAEYPEIATKAMKTLLSFPTSYLSEAGFSAVKATKTQWRSRLDIRSTLQVTLSPVTPGWDRLLAEKQVQGSYWFCVNGGWYFFYFVALCVCYHADFILFPHKLCETLHWILTPSAHLINPANVIREDVCSLCEEKHAVFVFVVYAFDFTQSSGSEIQSCNSLETRVDTRFNAKCELTGLRAVRLWSDHSRRMLLSGPNSPHSVPGRSAILGYFLSSRMKLQLVLVYMHTSISRFL